VRLGLVVRAWLGLRRPAALRRLASIGHPARFVAAAIVPAGRHFALAIAFLPRARREEATVTFLACKALDAFEDLSGDPAEARAGLRAAVAYLCGESVRPPRADRLVGAERSTGQGDVRESDRVEALLAARLPLLRAQLDALPADAVQRARAILARVGEGMLRDHADRRDYADHVLGEAVVYAASVCAPAEPPPVTACLATGRALQLANDVRDAGSSRVREILLYQALPELAIVPRLLRWLPASAGRGIRAAATLLVTTTCAFYLQRIRPLHAQGRDVAAPACVRHPLRAALAAASSARCYTTTVATIEAVLREALYALGALGTLGARGVHVASGAAGGRVASGLAGGPGTSGTLGTPLGGTPYRPALPPGTSDAVASASSLVALSMELVHAIPEAPLDARTGEAPGRALLLADHLLFNAIDRLSGLGPQSVAHIAALLEQLAAHPDAAALAESTALAAFAEEVG
jgi:hypothetical protein